MNNKLENKMDNYLNSGGKAEKGFALSLDGGGKAEKGFALSLNSGKKSNKGFTLVELLIAMAIFVMFTGIVIRSYADIVQSQRGANEYRMLYSDSRILMDKMIEDIRENSIFFGVDSRRSFNSAQDKLTLISKDSKVSTNYELIDGQIVLSRNISCGFEKENFVLNNERVFIEELSFYVTPSVDPYLSENSVFNSLQFHPKVTVYLRVSSGKYEIDFQTTVSSRNYSASPYIDITCI
jgi:prepilin-type N-terminal cleavage/methylation domain-containing protein